PAHAATYALESSTVRAAVLFAAGGHPAAEAVAPHAASLAKGVTTAMLIGKIKLAACALAALTLASAGVGLIHRSASAEQPASTGRQFPAGGSPAQPAADPPGERRHASANFEVTAPTTAIARQVSRAAEERRKALTLLWLGKEMPAWPERCPIRVKVH